MNKAAGIRFIAVALAAAAMLAVIGCGGDSATGTASTPHPAMTSAGAEGSAQEESSSSGQDSPAPASSREAAAAKQAAAGTVPSSGAGKHGPAITPPKGPQERAPTQKERAEATVVSMSLESPALEPGPESVSLLPATYTCDGKNIWPALTWGGVPPGTAELALTVLSLAPVNEALFFNWAAAGIDPGLTEIQSGHLPRGAVVGRNGYGKNGYSICPPKSGPETYIFALYALPEALNARAGFDPASLRREILDTSGNAGILAASYARG
jgi:phosphatidylethanolamine-binding protein (PEBP) family uncharacterized protein